MDLLGAHLGDPSQRVPGAEHDPARGIGDLGHPVREVVGVAGGIALGLDGPRVAGDVAAVVVGQRARAADVADRGQPPDPLIAPGRRIVGVGHVVGRRGRVVLRAQPVQRVVAVVGDHRTRVGALGHCVGSRCRRRRDLVSYARFTRPDPLSSNRSATFPELRTDQFLDFTELI